MSHALLSACQRSGYRSCHTPCFPDHHPCLAATAAVTAPGSKGVLLSPHARLVVSMVATQLTLFGKPAEKNESHGKKNGARRWKRGTITSEPGCESVEMQPVQDMVAEPGCESVEMQPSAMERPVQDKAAKPGSETQAASSSNDNITSFDPSLKRGHDPVCTRCGHHVDTCAPGVRLARKHPPRVAVPEVFLQMCDADKDVREMAGARVDRPHRGRTARVLPFNRKHEKKALDGP